MEPVPMSLDVLEAEICRWSANMTAAEARWLGLLAEFDRRGGWQNTGCMSCAAWLAWQTSLDLRTAHEKLRVAHALEAFPRLGVEMSKGVLSYAKARAVSRIATADNIDDLVDLALASTSNQLERFVSAYRRHEPDSDAAEARAHEGRGVSVRNDHGVATVTVSLPTESAAVLIGCIDRFLGDSDLSDPVRARRVDALLAMAAHAVATFDVAASLDGGYLATVHLTPEVLDDADSDSDTAAATDIDADADSGGDAHAGGGLCCVGPGDGLGADPVSVPRKSARRILCDAAMQSYGHQDDDEIDLRAGRRTVPRRMKRSLRLRDGGCRFPGCTHQAWVDAHHIVHWLDHGPTKPTNLVCLCRRHHRLMHEGGWTITGDANQQLTFHRPDGTIVDAAVPATPGESDPVAAHGRSDRDGRCGWGGEAFDLPDAVSVIMNNAEHRSRRRAEHTPQEHSPDEPTPPAD